MLSERIDKKIGQREEEIWCFLIIVICKLKVNLLNFL